ncbi:hypothetical protein DK26_14980 [Bosea sp. WAO]|uniref:hypothetical protein n=1 Tax=Bosea sp. WAO TaxID=406341 RepID=UPI0007479EEC|nr:hypothetical protein [Bosea sp. WAO]KUL94317.1 hypothetical protein DK26_14980 [Bosea sp. WAO]
MKQKLIAVRPLTYATRRLLAGDEFEATRSDARVLVAVNRARVMEEPREPGSLPPPPAAVIPRDEPAPTKLSPPSVPDQVVEIPDDWRDLHHMKMITIAKALGATPQNKVEAIAVLEAEVARRQAANAG